MNNKSVLMICSSVILGFIILYVSLFISIKSINSNDSGVSNRYQIISPNDSNIIIFDSETETYWNKYINPSEGPASWTKEILDFLKDK